MLCLLQRRCLVITALCPAASCAKTTPQRSNILTLSRFSYIRCLRLRQYKIYTDIRGVPWRRDVKRQWGNRKRRFSGLSDATPSEP